MLVILHWERFEPSLVDGAGTCGLEVSVPSLGVCQRKPSHELGDLVVVSQPRPIDQMPVVRHQTVGQDPDRLAVVSFLKHTLKRFVIRITFEEPFAPDRSVQHVVDHPSDNRTSSPGHHRTIPHARVGVNKRLPTPFMIGRGEVDTQAGLGVGRIMHAYG